MNSTGEGAYAAVDEIYATQRIGGGSVGFGDRVALLVVDFQQIYTRGRASTGLTAVERTAELLDHMRRAGLPVAFARVVFPAGAVPEDQVWTRKCPGLLEASEGSWEVQVDPLVEPLPDEPVHAKQVPSALFDGRLVDYFRDLDVDTILVAGTSTSGCVRATVVDGVSRGFRMVVVRECVADRSEPSAAAALFDIETKYGDVRSLAEARAHLEGVAAGARS